MSKSLLPRKDRFFLSLAVGTLVPFFSVCGQTFLEPLATSQFQDSTKNMSVIADYEFGTGPSRNVENLQQLASSFDPYGIAGTTPINKEWERYQPFNGKNFVLTPNTLDITATVPAQGGLFNGGINSGQIWTKQTFAPGRSGYNFYAFEVRMRIPKGPGMWPAAWFYAKQPGQTDGSEIDNPEFFNMKWQNEFDWTGFQHGPSQGSDIYSIKTNPWVWHPALDFSADYHDYETVWTPDAVYKYVDGTLIYAQNFHWTSPGNAQLGVNLAVGTDATANMPGLQPTSLSEFPSKLSVDHIKIWASN